MLQHLRIQNLALLESVSLEFEGGFTAVTGETGAGKSVLLGALALLAGGRADRSVVRHGAEACELEAVLWFPEPGAIDAVLEAQGLPRCEDGVLVLRRTIPRAKAPRVQVNGALATVQALQVLGERWIDFHGPGEPRLLLRPEGQLELLDSYGALGEAAQRYGGAYAAWRTAQRALAELTGAVRMSPEELEFAKSRLAQFERVDLTAEGVEALERDHRRAQRSQEILEAVGALVAGFAGERGVPGKLGPLVRQARHLATLDPAAAEVSARVEALAVEAADVAQELAGLSETLAWDASATAALEERMSTWLELQRRHGAGLEAVVAARDTLKRRLAEQGDVEERRAGLEAAVAAAEAAAREEAARLGAERRAAAARLEAEVRPVLGGLGFKRAEFAIRFEEGGALQAHGNAWPEFHFSPNPGSPMQPLARIASSGELARVMLALKAVLARVDATPVLVFDEVDANVGGEVGRVVGARLAEVAAGHQVFCITHLPQVAALAQQHLVVEKTAEADRTTVSLRAIQGDRAARVEELARMLGDRGAASARAHAEELLAPATEQARGPASGG